MPARSLCRAFALAERACAAQVGVGSTGVIPTTSQMLTEALEMGMDWSVREVRPACPLAVRARARKSSCWVRNGRRSAGVGASLFLAYERSVQGYSWAEDKELARNTAACSTQIR